MLVGHLAAGFAAKRIESRLSLGTTVLASMLPDLLWSIFMVAGIEHVQFKQATGAGNYFAASDIALSHSLLMDTIWAALLALAYFWLRRNPRGAWVLFAAVLSHWVLDVVAHRADMPLAPGVHTLLGLASGPRFPRLSSSRVVCGSPPLSSTVALRAPETGQAPTSFGSWSCY